MDKLKNDADTSAESQTPQEYSETIGTQTKIHDESVPWNVCENEVEKGLKETRSTPHSKKVMKHALRQQAKRRRKNTTIAAGNPAPTQRHALSPISCDIDEMDWDTTCYRQPTMNEILASIPGFSLKPRKRSQKKLSAVAQLEQTKEGCVDLETPDSILVNANLRSLLNKHTFNSLPSLYQYKLLQLLPHVDRTGTGNDSVFRLSGSGLNNEFFARACLDWKERLAEGEFTQDNQTKLKLEQEKEKSKLDPWKLKHFEPTWGESLREWPLHPEQIPVSTSPALTVTTSPGSTMGRTKAGKQSPHQSIPAPPPPISRVRTVGAVTRAVTSYREKRAALGPLSLCSDTKRNRHSGPDMSENICDHDEGDISKVAATADIVTKESKTELNDDNPNVQNQFVESEILISTEEIVSTSLPVVVSASSEDEPGATLGNTFTIGDSKSTSLLVNNIGIPSNDILVEPIEKSSNRLGKEKKVRDSENFDTDLCTSKATSELENVEPEDSPRLEKPHSPPDETHLTSTHLMDESINTLSHCNIIDKASESPEHYIAETPETSRITSPVLEGTPIGEEENTKQNLSHYAHDNQEQSDNVEVNEFVQSAFAEHVSNAPINDDTKNSTEAPDDNMKPEFIQRNIILGYGVNELNMVLQEDNKTETENVQFTYDGPRSSISNEVRVDQGRFEGKQPKLAEDINQMENLQQQCLELPQMFQQQANQPHNLVQHVEQSRMPLSSQQQSHLTEQIDHPQYFYQRRKEDQMLQIGQSKFIHAHEEANVEKKIEYPSALISERIDHGEQISRQGSIHQQKTDQENIFQRHLGTFQQLIEPVSSLPASNQTGEISQPRDSLLKSNVVMMPQVVVNMQQTSSSQVDCNMDHQVPISREKDINAVITIPVVNERHQPDLHVIDDSAMSNVPVLNEVILPDVPGTQMLSGRTATTEAEEKWEVMQVNPEKNEGLYFKEDEAAILAAAWDVVGSSTQFQDLQPPVVIPLQEELEVRLQESSLPAPQWVEYSTSSDKSTSGHVKLELEVTLTPEVDSQVSFSSMEAASEPRVIPPTTIVCLPQLSTSVPAPPPVPASSAAIPYLSLTTSTPVRAVPTKPLQSKNSGRGGRSGNNKPPPGAVNLERSYQICQAVIQNSPNRHQLRCQLKPPPALLGKKLGQGQQHPTPFSSVTQQQRPKARQQTVVLRHMIPSNSGGIPVSMAVLPSHPSHIGGVRRSNSAPPSNSETQACGGRGRPASVGGPGLSCGGCSMRPLIPCRRCGDFCHEDCITPSRLCVTCHSA